MKQLTYSSMAAARLRANKRQYLSLVLGIFLSIFLISTLVLSVWGIYQAELQKRYDKVGYLDMVILDNDVMTDESVMELGDFDRLGHAYISGVVTDKNIYLGYYDETGSQLMNLSPKEGRLPENPGEIAMEVSAMDVLGVDWQLGQTVELDITPVDGVEEKRQYTLVGFLPERTVYLERKDYNNIGQFPAIVTSTQEQPFDTGRLAFHYVLGLGRHGSISGALENFWEQNRMGAAMYGLSASGEQVWFYGTGYLIESNREMFTMILMACVLAGSLILSCGIGISGAMEGVLSKRREEIGVLRALGATRRQIRRMFGRENLILAAVVSPLSILISCAAVWGLSLLMPESLKFAINLWLILPIAAFSVIVILLSGYLPLVRASKLMPMSVIRDTAMLRRSKGVKSKKEFSATKLISARQVRFNPTRQIGASLLVGLMLLCSGLLPAFISDYANYTMGDAAEFRINSGASWYYDGHIGVFGNPSMDKRSIAQVRSLPNVESIHIDRHMNVTMLLDHVPLYAMLDDQYGMLDDEMFETAMSYDESIRDFWEADREDVRKEYQQFLKDYQIPAEAYRTAIVTVDLDSENLNKLNPFIESGKINVDAINAGTQVLVVAPEVWIKSYETGYGFKYWHSEEAVKADPTGEGAVLAAWNDSFTAGEVLPLMQLYRTEADGPVTRVDAAPTIGAVLSWDAGLINGVMSHTYMITTEQGLENMGFPMEGLWEIEVYLDGDVSLEEGETLERQLNAIARRIEGYTVFNYLEDYRQREAAKQQEILLYSAITIVFFSVSVGMIVSSVTRQLNSEGKTIGMLRAVGADERAILECYSGQINASIAGGMGIGLGLYFVFLVIYFISAIDSGYFPTSDIPLLLLMGVSICVMGALCLIVCKFMLRFRIRETVNKSIIDNIKEL